MSAPSWITCLILGALVGSATGCTSSPPPEPPPWAASAAQGKIPPAPEAPPEDAASAPDPNVPTAPLRTAPEVPEDTSVIVIDEPEAPTTSDLVTASRSAREQRERNPATTRITNKNLKDFAGGLVTTAAPKAAAPSPAEVAVGEMAAEEQVWRDRILDLRSRARRSRDEIHRLEGEVAGLRRSFYIEDDPYVRDGQIKPTWDRAIDNLGIARRDAEALQRELARVLDEARQAGALPGWLREGIELESDLAPETDTSFQPTEPVDAAEPREPIPPP